jgi:two-component system phosphate regulon sensor histidine kinase PhoR
MRPGQILLGALTIAVVPVTALLLLAASGAAEARPALAGCLATAVAAGLIATFLARELATLTDLLRAAASGERRPPAYELQLPAFQRIAADVDRMRRLLAARAELVERLRQVDNAIVDRFPDPLILLGPDRSVRRANPASVSAYGTDLASVLRHPTLLGALDRAFSLRGGGVDSVEISLPAPVPRAVFATAIVFDPPLPDGEQALIMLADRTREHAAERTRSDFVANVSHELRTPLASLIGFIETLRGPARDDAAARERFLAIMAEQGARMNRLIDDLLSLSRIELTEHQAPAERLHLGVLLPRIVAGFEPRLRERGNTLRLELPDNLPPVLADADQITQVVQNLLDNAVKYGRAAGAVRLLVAAHAGGARWPARPGVVIAVGDDGMGIAREHLPRLGERFYRVDRGRSRAVGGTGLGLAIVKHIVSRHRGQLHIESVEGAGTTVSVWLPQAGARPREMLAAPQGARDGG